AFRDYDIPDNLFFRDSLAPEPLPLHLSYDLLVSLQRHPTNPNPIDLTGKTITFEGAAGQVARIAAYHAESGEYILDRNSAVTESDRFEISFDPLVEFADLGFTDHSPVTDSYDVVLTGRPDFPVIVNVTPAPT